MIELLIVVAIIAILAGMLLPVLGKARDLARKADCISRLKQQGIIFASYGNDNNEWIPCGSGSIARIYPYAGYSLDAGNDFRNAAGSHQVAGGALGGTYRRCCFNTTKHGFNGGGFRLIP